MKSILFLFVLTSSLNSFSKPETFSNFIFPDKVGLGSQFKISWNTTNNQLTLNNTKIRFIFKGNLANSSSLIQDIEVTTACLNTTKNGKSSVTARLLSIPDQTQLSKYNHKVTVEMYLETADKQSYLVGTKKIELSSTPTTSEIVMCNSNSEPEIVPTYNNLSIYWKESAPTNEKFLGEHLKKFGDAKVSFCEINTPQSNVCITPWSEAIPLWYDQRRGGEYRGSILNLKSGTSYKVRLLKDDGLTGKEITSTTWKDNYITQRIVYLDLEQKKFPSGKTIIIDSSYSGHENGYTVFTTKDPHFTFNVRNPNDPDNITWKTNKTNKANIIIQPGVHHLVIRGLKLRGAHFSSINLGGNFDNPINESLGISNIIIENNDISDWGSFMEQETLGSEACNFNGQSVKPLAKGKVKFAASRSHMGAILGNGPGIKQITIQNNNIAHPRVGSNSWYEIYPKNSMNSPACERHPYGPAAIVLMNTNGNFVIRNNSITSAPGFYYNDGIIIGGENAHLENHLDEARDSDINNNIISHVWDDAIETDNTNMQMRIWGNFFDKTFVGISLAPSSVGPVYVFENIGNQSQATHFDLEKNGSISGQFIKNTSSVLQLDSSGKNYSLAKTYVFNNTTMPTPFKFKNDNQNLYSRSTPYYALIADPRSGNPLTNYVVMNNISKTIYEKGVGINHYACNISTNEPRIAQNSYSTKTSNITTNPIFDAFALSIQNNQLWIQNNISLDENFLKNLNINSAHCYIPNAKPSALSNSGLASIEEALRIGAQKNINSTLIGIDN